MNIPIQQFGKDHWSLLAYFGCRVTDNQGTLNPSHMRDKLMRGIVAYGAKWKPEYGTRLKGYFDTSNLESEKVDATKRLPDHDDYNCLDDMEVAGLVENIGTGFQPLIKFTKVGFKFLSALTEHKANGGVFATFEPSAKLYAALEKANKKK